MADVSGVGGPSGGASSGGVGASGGPSGNSASKDSGSVSKSNDTAPAAGSGQKESTVDRGDAAQVSDSGAAASHDALGTGDAAKSDPDSAKEVAAAQADVAESVTGGPDTSEADSAEAASETAEVSDAAAAEEAAPAEEAAAVDEVAPPAEEQALTEEQQARMDEYNSARATLDKAIAGDMVNPADLNEAREVVLGYADELGAVHGQLSSSFAELDTAVARQTDFLANEAQMLSEEEKARAEVQTASEVAAAQAPFDEATKAMIDTIQDPVMQAFISDLPPEDQTAFFEDLSHYMPASEVGRQFSADFTDGLAEIGATGQTANGISEIAAGVRDALSVPEDIAKFDASMGVMVGTGLAQNPQNADSKLQAAASALGMSDEEVAALANPAVTAFEEKGVFTQTAAAAFSAFDAFKNFDAPSDPLSDTSTALTYADLGMSALTELTQMAAKSTTVGSVLGAAQNGLTRLGGMMSNGGKVLGAVGLGFSVAATVDAIRQNNVTGAVSGGLGVAGGAATLAASILGTEGLALAGYALVGAGLALPAVVDGLQDEAFVERALAAALGPDESSFSLRGRMIGTAPPSGAAMLDALRPADMTIAQYLDSRIGMINPDASEFAPTAWSSILDDFTAQQLAQQTANSQ